MHACRLPEYLFLFAFILREGLTFTTTATAKPFTNTQDDDDVDANWLDSRAASDYCRPFGTSHSGDWADAALASSDDGYCG